MGFAEVIGIITGILKFWDSVVWLVKKLESTPEEKRAGVIAKVKSASELADETHGDTSGYEDIINS